MNRQTKLSGKIVLGYLERFPNTPSLTLARKIYNEDDNHLVFTDTETVRTAIRYYRGIIGFKNRKKCIKQKFYK